MILTIMNYFRTIFDGLLALFQILNQEIWLFEEKSAKLCLFYAKMEFFNIFIWSEVAPKHPCVGIDFFQGTVNYSYTELSDVPSHFLEPSEIVKCCSFKVETCKKKLVRLKSDHWIQVTWTLNWETWYDITFSLKEKLLIMFTFQLESCHQGRFT